MTPGSSKSARATATQTVWLRGHIRGLYYKTGGLQSIEWVNAGVFGQVSAGNGMYSLAAQDLLHKTKPYLTKPQIMALANEMLKLGRSK